MKRVIVEALLPGMILAKSVLNNAGLPIMAAGAELDSTVIQRFKTLGCTAVYVEGEADDDGGKTLDELQAELEHRFRSVSHDPLQQVILQRLKQHLVNTHGVREQRESHEP